MLVALFVIGIVQAFLVEKNKGIFLVLLTILTFVISYILSFKMPMVPRYLIFLTIVFFIGIAVSYRVFYSLWNNKAVVYGFIVVLFVISVSVLVRWVIIPGIPRRTGEVFRNHFRKRPVRAILSFRFPGTLPSLLIIIIPR